MTITIRCSLILLFLSSSLSLFALEKLKIHGQVINQYNQPIQNVSVLLYDVHNVIIASTSTNREGNFTFNDVLIKTFYINLSSIGYQEHKTQLISPVDLKVVELESIVLKELNILIDEIKVEYSAPPITQKDGNLIVNLSNNIGAKGTNVLEQIEKIPGVQINRQNAEIIIRGRTGATILINGRKTYMSNDALIQYLAGQSSANIKQIEILTNPSASMDADGSAGLINIVIENAVSDKLNGNIDINGGLGNGSVLGINFSLNINAKRIRSSIQYNFTRNSQDQISYNKRVKSDSDLTWFMNTKSNRTPLQKNNSIGYDFSFLIDSTATFSVGSTYYNNLWSMSAINQIYSLNDNVKMNTFEKNHWKHFGVSTEFNKRFKKNKSIDFYFNYLFYRASNPSIYSIDSTLNIQSSNSKLNIISEANKKTPIRIYAPQINFTIVSNAKMQLNGGIKSSFSSFINNVETIADSKSLSEIIVVNNNSTLHESIFASFLENRYQLNNSLNVKIGVRHERTNFRLLSGDNSVNINRKFDGFFPSVTLNFKTRFQKDITFYYNRRINRPTFGDIAPFVLYIDPNTLFTGNTGISPSYSNNFGVDLNVGKVLLSGIYSREENSLSKFQISVDEQKNLQIIRPENLGTSNVVSVSSIIPLKINNKLNLQSTISTMYQNINAGPVYSYQKLSQTSFQINSSAHYKFNDNFSTELSGFYNSDILSGTSLIKSFGGLNLSVQKEFNRKFIARLYVTDIFNSIQSDVILKFNNNNINNGFDFSQRTFKVGLSYKFGNQKNNRQKVDSAKEEKSRVN